MDDWDDIGENNSTSSSDAEDSNFKILTIADVEQLMSERIDYVKSVYPMLQNPDTLLIYNKWNEHVLFDHLTIENCENFFATAKLVNTFTTDSSKQTVNACNICSSALTLFKRKAFFRCGHGFCENCYNGYLKKEIMDECTVLIRCPAENCEKIIDCDIIIQSLPDPSVQQKYQHLITNNFIQNGPSLRRCISSDCTSVIQAFKIYPMNCKCDCGQHFCFNCSDESHDPIPCNLYFKWQNEEFLETHYYLKRRTKTCPACNVIIERTGSVRKMTCGICAFEFCSDCSKEWVLTEIHASCSNDMNRNYPDPLKDNNMSLEQEKMAISEANSTYLKEMMVFLCGIRKQLLFSYMFIYSLEPHVQKGIFESNLGDLQSVTEKLSMLLHEENANEQTIQNHARDCQRRREILEQHISEGYENNWWDFKTDW